MPPTNVDVPDHVRHWHYARQRLLAGSDPAQIEAHARDQLGRAVNIGNLVGFIGSGVSMTFGRLSWNGLVETMAERGLSGADEESAQHDANSEAVGDIKACREGLERIGFSGGKAPEIGSEAYATAFQQCEVLWETVRYWRKRRLGSGSRKESSLFDKPMRDHAASLLCDDRGHADVMISKLASDLGDRASITTLDTLKPIYGDEPKPWQHLFTCKALGLVIAEVRAANLGGPFDNLLAEAGGLAGEPGDPVKMLQPVHRFLPLALMRLVPEPRRGQLLAGIAGISVDQTRQRTDIIKPDRDPLAVMTRDLNIRRFLTTNYDFDIETFLKDAKFDQTPGDSGSTRGRDPLGHRSRDFVIDNPMAAHLLEFAMRDRGGRFDVAHLHGRTDNPDGMVVTTEDYRKRYYSADGERAIVGDALSLVFDSNPVLFVGNGMSEDDLKRPMRHFLSDHTPRARTLIALLPARRRLEQEVLQKVDLLKNYGVYTIHYGHAKLGAKDVRWLQLMVELIGDLRKWLNGKTAMFKMPDPGKTWTQLLADPAHGASPLATITKLDDVACDTPDRNLVLETALLNAILDMARGSPGVRPGRDVVNAGLAMLDGIEDAIFSTALCCALKRLEQDWVNWKKRWFSLPVPRSTGGPSQKDGPGGGHVLHHRHRIALRDKPDWQDAAILPPGDRFFARAPSHPFDALFEALEEAAGNPGSMLSHKPKKAGRRLFVLHARRGVGKGHFFRLLSEKSRREQFQRKSWPQNHAAAYVSSVFINLGFSLEVASAFDRITDILVEQAPHVFESMTVSGAMADDPVVQITDASVSLRKNRIARLTQIITLYGKHRGKAGKKRLMIALNSFQIMFDAHGEPKNAQMRRLIEALLGGHGRDAPIDFVVVTREPGFPTIFRKPSEGAAAYAPISIPLEHLLRRNVTARARQIVERRMQGLKVNVRTLTPHVDPASFLHLLRDARAINILATYFPAVALSIAAKPGQLSTSWGEPDDVELVVPTALLRRDFGAILTETEGKLATTLEEQAAMAKEAGLKPLKLKDIVAMYLANLAAACVDGTPLAHDVAAGGTNVKALAESLAIEAITGFDVAAAYEVEADFSYLYEAVGRGRFSLTIVAAAATESAWLSEADNQGLVRTLRTARVITFLRDICLDLAGVRDRSVDDLALARVLDFYRQRHDQRSVLPELCDLKERYCGLKPDDLVCLAGAEGWRVQQDLIWHMAVVGQPVEAAVLARAPRVVSTCHNILGTKAGPQQREALVNAALDLLVHRCLAFRIEAATAGDNQQAGPETLQHWRSIRNDDQRLQEWRTKTVRRPVRQSSIQKHRLVWTTIRAQTKSIVNTRPQMRRKIVSRAVSPPPSIKGRKSKPRSMLLSLTLLKKRRTTKAPRSNRRVLRFVRSEQPVSPIAWRFSVHRNVQRAVLRNMNALVEDAAAVDHFSLTQYLTQPNDMPRMSRDAFNDIRKLVAAWTGLPDGDAREKPPYQLERERGGEDADKLRAKMLRATLGVVRSIYSAGVVVRFDEFARAGGMEAPEGGFFESYRRLIRWMLLEANAIMAPKVGLSGFSAQTEIKPHAHAPFLAEELVWLFNECGVVSYMQGHLTDADALFVLAAEAAQRFEYITDHGAMHTRIQMNRAYLDIERGRARDVQRSMREIAAREDEHPVVRLCARGVLGLIEHLAGNLDAAENQYKDVIAKLAERGRARSAAIFSRHLADLYRVQGPEQFGKARKAVNEAIAYAMRDGHEDVRQLAALSDIHLKMLEPEADPLTIQHEIESVITYGRVMGAPRLVAEGLLLRGVLQLRQGDTRDAARVLVQGLAIAGECDIKLRQVTGLMLLADAYDKRNTPGERDAARILLKRAYELAGRCDYANAKASIAQSLARRGS